MTVLVPAIAMRDVPRAVHEQNPLGGHACLACALPFPCPTARGGEQLRLVGTTS